VADPRRRSAPPQTSHPANFPARWLFAAVLAAVLIPFLGCGRKSLPRAEIRAITSEVVNAARRVAGRQSEITIRPEVEPSRAIWRGGFAADDIYVSLGDPRQTTQLKQAIAGIARRHKLSLSETSTAGVVRFDLVFNGSRTHTIHVVAPLSAPSRPAVRPASGNPRLAIIVDDLGSDRSAADSLLALPFPLTISVLPHLPVSAEVAEEAFRRGDEVLLHLPMESESNGTQPEKIELRMGMYAGQVESVLAGMLETVPHAAGVNNHQGSRATADPALMEALMPALRQRGLFFIDSRTTAATVAYDTAERLGVRAASRKVFLDDTPAREAILAQLELAAGEALRNGEAIAIGHPHPATIATLAEGVPRIEARGIRLVFASALVH